MSPGEAARSIGELRFVVANGLRFACYEAGQGPLVLLLHGFPDTPHTWFETMEALAAHGFRAVAPYMRGYPPTEIPGDANYSSRLLGGDALGLMEALGESRAVLVGHDWGAFAAYAAASQEPTRVRKLVVLSIPHPRTLKTDFRQLRHSSHFIEFQWRSRIVRKLKQANFAYVREIYRRWSPSWDVPESELAPVKASLRAPGGLEGALGYYWTFGREALLPSGRATREMLRRKTSVPTLAFRGENDGAVDPATFKAMREAFTGALEVVSLPGVGHFLHREAPQAFIEKLLSFLALE